MGVLSGQAGIVTGAGRGFGRAIALRLAAEGALLALVSRNRRELEAVATEISAAGGRAIVAVADVAEPADVIRACREARAALGPISLLVSNAGVPGPFGPLWVTDIEKWWRAEAIHIRAPYLFMHELMPEMVAMRRGRIIVISAVASRMTLAGLSAYSVGKAAINKLVEMAAAESAAHDVRVFAVEPGFVVTKLGDDTYNDPDAQKYLPHMMQYLIDGKAREHADADLHRTAQRCLDLAAGRYDILSGRYMELPDPIGAWADEARARLTNTDAKV
jgi:NAD(P)-dependent dehydrogenase (short-subunit alcohol dehydrogenase family)